MIKIPIVKKLYNQGDSKALVLPKTMIELCDIDDSVEIDMKGKTITIRAHKNGDE